MCMRFLRSRGRSDCVYISRNTRQADMVQRGSLGWNSPNKSSQKESKHVGAIEENMGTRGHLSYACEFRIVRNCCGTEGIGAKAAGQADDGRGRGQAITHTHGCRQKREGF